MIYNRIKSSIPSITLYSFICLICMMVKIPYSAGMNLSHLHNFIQLSYLYCSLQTVDKDFLLFFAALLPILYLIVKFSSVFNFQIRNQSYLLLFYKSKAKYISKELSYLMFELLFTLLITFTIQVLFHSIYYHSISMHELFKSLVILMFYLIHIVFYIIIACLLNALFSNATLSIILVTSMLLISAMLSNTLKIFTYVPAVFFLSQKNISITALILYGLLDLAVFIYFYYKTKRIELY